MSDKAAIGITSERTGELWLYLQLNGNRAEELLAEALKDSLSYKPHDADSVAVFVTAAFTGELGPEHLFLLGSDKPEGCYITLTVDCDAEAVRYESIYDNDSDRTTPTFRAYFEEVQWRQNPKRDPLSTRMECSREIERRENEDAELALQETEEVAAAAAVDDMELSHDMVDRSVFDPEYQAYMQRLDSGGVPR